MNAETVNRLTNGEAVPPPPDLKALLAADRKAREEAFVRELSELKARHRCELRVVQTIVNGVPGAMQFQVVSLE